MNQDDEQFHQFHHELIIDENLEQLFEIVLLEKKKKSNIKINLKRFVFYHFQ